jgi:glycosyltransferase involved in cell wall biosynthesis
VIALLERPIRLDVFRPIAAHLERMGLPRPIIVSIHPTLPPSSADAELRKELPFAAMPVLLRHAAMAAVIRAPFSHWSAIAPDARTDDLLIPIREGLPRIALLANQLDNLVRRAQPSAIVAFQEVGPWARIIPAVAAAHGVPTIDLPHAEAHDPIAAWGLKFDAVVVYGPRSAAILRGAGIDESRIQQVGPLRYDSLIARMAGMNRVDRKRSRSGVREIIYASQPVVTWAGLSRTVKVATYRSALTVAASVAPARLVVRPHPNESLVDLRQMIAESQVPQGVELVVEELRDLHDLLLNAWLLVTATSQSVFEAAIAGVPTITVRPEARTPVTHAEEGFSIEVRDPDSAAAAAIELLSPAAWQAATARSAAALRPRFGELDGRASERAAAVIASLAEGDAGGPSRRGARLVTMRARPRADGANPGY